jgi:hypothetical protein
LYQKNYTLVQIAEILGSNARRVACVLDEAGVSSRKHSDYR